uniref:Uncharacterized protein n=1 Tax=Hyaloperonospora arabidopsidis (strain Emoy2) TaxID=559515 RepID=M4B7U7_HYAAE
MEQIQLLHMMLFLQLPIQYRAMENLYRLVHSAVRRMPWQWSSSTPYTKASP